MGFLDEVKDKAKAAADVAKVRMEQEAKAMLERRRLQGQADSQAKADRAAYVKQIQRDCPLPLSHDRGDLPGGLKLFDDEYVVAVGKDWGWSSERLTLTTHRVIWSHGRLSKDQKVIYLTDVRDVAYHKPLVGHGTLALDTGSGRVEGLPAASNGQKIRNDLLAMVHYARRRAEMPRTVLQQPQAPPAPAPVAQPAPDKYEKLKQLGELRAQGILTEEEFQAEKTKLLS